MTSNSRSLPALLSALAAYVDERVEEKVAEAVEERVAELRGSNVYSSKDLPPGYSRQTFRRVAPKVPGAKLSGYVWTVPRDAWDRFQAARAEARRTKRRPPRPPASAPTPVQEIARAIVDANARTTREAS